MRGEKKTVKNAAAKKAKPGKRSGSTPKSRETKKKSASTPKSAGAPKLKESAGAPISATDRWDGVKGVPSEVISFARKRSSRIRFLIFVPVIMPRGGSGRAARRSA